MLSADTVDEVKARDSTPCDSTPLHLVIKQELPWSVEEDINPSAVHSTEQLMSNNTSGSPLSRNASHACPHCSAALEVVGGLESHMTSAHGGESLDPGSAVKSAHPACGDRNTNKKNGPDGRCSTKRMDCRKDSKISGDDFVIKLEPSWSMNEEDPQDDHPSAVSQPDIDDDDVDSSNSASRLLENTNLLCQYCSAAFVLFSSLELHMALSHGESLYDLFPVFPMFEYCGGGEDDGNTEKSGGNAGNGKSASVGEEGGRKKVRRYVCDVCGKAFTRTDHLKAHKLLHTGHRPYVCDLCSKAFSRASHLKTHKQMHVGHKPFACEDCGKAFTQAGDLKRHRKVHVGEVPCSCPVCGTDLKDSRRLKTHIRTVHADYKPHVCDVCGAAFSRTGNLETHRRIHTGEKPYVCRECGKDFVRSGHLKRHLLTHSGEKPHSCPHCPAAFTWSHYLKDHIQKVHQ